MREAFQAYVKRVGELAEPVRMNEPATERSPVGPLFPILGSGPAGPRAEQPARAGNGADTDFVFLLTSIRRG